MSTEIDNLSVKIEAEGKEASDSLSKLASSLEKLAEKSEKLSKLTSSMTKLQKAISGITNRQVNTLSKLTKSLSELDGKNIKLPSMTSFANGIERVSKTDLSAFREKLRGIADAVKELNQSVANGDLRSFVSDLAAIAKNADRAAKAVQGVSRGAVGNNSPPPKTDVSAPISSSVTASAIGSESISAANRISGIFAGLKSKITAAVNGLGSFGDKLSAVAKTASGPFGKLQKGLSGVTGGFRKASVVSNGFSNSLLSIISRSALYYAIYAGFSMVTKGVSTGILNLYYANTQFAGSMDRCATEAQYLQNSIAAALSPAITALVPAIQYVVGAFVDFINVINMCIATITGQSSWTRAVKAPATYADALDGATGSAGKAAKATKGAQDAAEEYKRTLMGFDEINKLDDPTSSSGSGGSGGGSGGSGISVPDYSSMFTTEQVPLNGITSIVKDFMDFLKSLDFGPLEKAWENLKEKAAALGEVLKGALYWGYENVLKPLAKWTIEEAAPRVLNLLAAALNLVTVALEALSPLWQWAWDNIFAPIANFAGDALLGVLDGLTEKLNALSGWISQHQTAFQNIVLTVVTFVAVWKTAAIVTTIINGIATAFKTLQTAFSMVSSVTALVSALTGVAAIAVPVVAGIAAVIAIGVLLWKNWDTIKAKSEPLRTALEKIEESFQLLKDAVINQLLPAWKESLLPLWERLQAVAVIAGAALAGVLNGIIVGLAGVMTALSGVVEIISGVFTGIVGIVTGNGNLILDAFNSIVDGIVTVLTGGFQAAIGFVVGFVDGVISFFTNLWDELVGHSIVPDTIDGIVECFSGLWSRVTGVLSDFVKNVVKGFTDMKSNVTTAVTNIYNTVSSKFTNVASTISSKVTSAKTAISTGFNNAKNSVTTAVSGIYSTVNSKFTNVKTTISNAVSSAYNTVSTKFTNIKNTITSKINAARDAVSSAVSKIKSLFNFKWSLPDLKLPHIKYSLINVPVFGSIPNPATLHVDWYAKGGILDGAQIFGMAGNTLLGGGEAGREAVLPLDRNTDWMDNLADKVAQRVGGESSSDRPIVIHNYIVWDGNVIGKSITKYYEGQAAQGNFPLSGLI